MTTWTSRPTVALDASPLHAEALARLDFLVASRSPLGLLVGPAGCGKSAVFSQFALRAERQGNIAAYLNLTGADEPTLTADLATALALAPASALWQTWRQITDRFTELRLDSLHAVLLLDDLDRAPSPALALVERLLALDNAPLTLAASARPETASRLGSRILDHAALRIDLAPWNDAETTDYLNRRTAADPAAAAFSPPAARRLFELSAGAPRKLNQLAQLAEIAAKSHGQATIDQETILAVHEELTIS